MGMQLALFSIWFVSDALAGADPDFVASLAYFPGLIIGLMIVGGAVGALVVMFVRRSKAQQTAAPGPGHVESSPPAPTQPEMPGFSPVSLGDTGGFEPSDDFEEPTCFAELPRKRTDD
jgi:hypothetical protein